MRREEFFLIYRQYSIVCRGRVATGLDISLFFLLSPSLILRVTQANQQRRVELRRHWNLQHDSGCEGHDGFPQEATELQLLTTTTKLAEKKKHFYSTPNIITLPANYHKAQSQALMSPRREWRPIIRFENVSLAVRPNMEMRLEWN